MSLVTTIRVIRDQVKNVLDYLQDADLALYCNEVSMHGTRVSWYSYDAAAEFLITRRDATIEQYLHWLRAGSFSAILLDASLLQISYDVHGERVIGHRLVYVPCPFQADATLLNQGEPVFDVVSLYDNLADVVLRSPLRFDYDPNAAAPHHPAAHLTVNSPDCRIACVAPMHVHRFIDFVFRHFYPRLWHAHSGFFAEAAWRHVGERVLSDEDRTTPHLMWDVYATASG